MSNGPGLKTLMFTTGVPRDSLFLSCKGRSVSMYYLSTDEKRVMHLLLLTHDTVILFCRCDRKHSSIELQRFSQLCFVCGGS